MYYFRVWTENARIIYETEKSKFSIKYPTLRFHNRNQKIKIAYGESC